MRSASISSHLETNVQNGTRYSFVVTAVNETGESPPSDEVSAMPRARPGFGDSSIASNNLARFTCALLATGEVSCGGGYPGCRVIGGCLATIIGGVENATMVAVGANFVCVLLDDGARYCWGSAGRRPIERSV